MPAIISAVSAAIIAACAVITLGLRVVGGDVTATTTPWWAITVAVVALVALVVNIGAIIYRFARGTAQPRRFPQDFLTRIERLCADEHEIALRTVMPFASPPDQANGNNRLDRRDYFRTVISALEAPCRDLDLRITLKAIEDALRDLNRDLSTNAGYHRFNDVSQALKRELDDKWRLVRAP